MRSGLQPFLAFSWSRNFPPAPSSTKPEQLTLSPKNGQLPPHGVTRRFSFAASLVAAPVLSGPHPTWGPDKNGRGVSGPSPAACALVPWVEGRVDGPRAPTRPPFRLVAMHGCNSSRSTPSGRFLPVALRSATTCRSWRERERGHQRDVRARDESVSRFDECA